LGKGAVEERKEGLADEVSSLIEHLKSLTINLFKEID
jgi:hypothetical protein